VARRPPKMIAEIGTPFGSSYSSAMIGHCLIGVQKRLFGWLDSSPESGVHSRPFQSVRWVGGGGEGAPHPPPPSSVSATLVKTELPFSIVRIAFGLVFQPVPGATPNRPNSGFTAY